MRSLRLSYSSIRSLVLAASASAGLLSIGCSGVAPEAYEIPDQKTLVEDTHYMARMFQAKIAASQLGFAKLDLADDGQYAFVKHRLLATGNTPENSPRLFEVVESSRKAAKSRFQIDGNVASTSQALDVEGDWCGQFMNAPFTLVGSQSELDATAYVTCFDGASYVFGDERAYETDEAETYYTEIGSTFAEEYAGGTDFDAVNLKPQLPINVGKYHYIDSLVIAEDDVNGKSHISYAYAKVAAADKAASISVKHPVQNPETSTLDIRSCVSRSAAVGVGDCDYAGVNSLGVPGSGTLVGVAQMSKVSGTWKAHSDPANRWYPVPGFNVNNMYLPLAGTYDAGIKEGVECNITGYDQPTTKAILMRNTSGGWCKADPTSDDLYKSLMKTPTSGMTDNFNVLANFGANCLANLQKVTLKLTVTANTACGQRLADAQLARVDYRNSCFAQGTGVLRADGKYVAVESLEIGSKLIADGTGLALTVISLSRGPDLHPLVRIIDNRGHDVLVTEKHPVVTTAGLMAAEKLKEGDEVRTESGVAQIVSIERVPYDGDVYNVTLGTTEELAALPSSARTLFAGGILVGDNHTQQELTQAELHKPREVSNAWMSDYSNDVARGTRVIRPN